MAEAVTTSALWSALLTFDKKGDVLIPLVALVHPGFSVDEDTQNLIVTVAMATLALLTAVYSHGRAEVRQAGGGTPTLTSRRRQ